MKVSFVWVIVFAVIAFVFGRAYEATIAGCQDTYYHCVKGEGRE